MRDRLPRRTVALAALLALSVVSLWAFRGRGEDVATSREPQGAITFVAFSRADGSEALFRADLQAGTCRRLMSLGDASYSELSPTGEHLIRRDATTTLVNTETHSTIKVWDQSSGSFAWSSDGSAVGFLTSDRAGTTRAHVVTVTGEPATRISPAPGSPWSPDGGRVAYLESSGDGRAGTLRTVLKIAPVQKRLTGTTVYELTNPYGDTVIGSWGAGGRTLYMTLSGLGTETTALDTATGQRRPAPEAFSRGIWSPNRRQVLFTQRGPWGVDAVYVMNADGSARHRLTGTTERRAPASIALGWSPENEWIVYSRNQLSIMRRNGMEKRTLCKEHARWAPAKAVWHVDR